MEEFAHQLLHSAPYMGLFVMLVLTGMGLPLPEDIPLIVAGALCAREDGPSLWIMMPVAFVAIVGGDTMLYLMGRRYGHHITKTRFLGRFLTEKHLNKAELMFQKHGGKTIIMARFMPGIRAAFYFSAGVFRMPAWKMVLYDGGAALVSVPLFMLSAYHLADNLPLIRKVIGRVEVILLLAVVSVVVTLWLLRRRNGAGAANEAEQQERALVPAAPTAGEVAQLRVMPSVTDRVEPVGASTEPGSKAGERH